MRPCLYAHHTWILRWGRYDELLQGGRGHSECPKGMVCFKSDAEIFQHREEPLAHLNAGLQESQVQSPQVSEDPSASYPTVNPRPVRQRPLIPLIPALEGRVPRIAHSLIHVEEGFKTECTSRHAGHEGAKRAIFQAALRRRAIARGTTRGHVRRNANVIGLPGGVETVERQGAQALPH